MRVNEADASPEQSSTFDETQNLTMVRYRCCGQRVKVSQDGNTVRQIAERDFAAHIGMHQRCLAFEQVHKPIIAMADEIRPDHRIGNYHSESK